MAKGVPIVFIVLIFLAMFLHANGQLKPVVTEIVETPGDTNMPSLGKIALAAVLYLVVLSFLNDEEGLRLTVLVALGALLIDYESMKGKGNDLISSLTE